MISLKEIKKRAQEVGFDLCGVVPVHPLADAEARFRRWIDEGCHASLTYLERNIEKRFDPVRLVEGARAMIVCGVNYRSSHSGTLPDGVHPQIASYALNRDYHRTIKEMLFDLGRRLQEVYPDRQVVGRAFTDSAPVAEKSWAVEAGLGWIGHHTLLINPRFGTYIHLGELFLLEECDHYDQPFVEDRCGECRICRMACPVGAIREDRTLDAQRCIACRTIERVDGEDVSSLHGWIFGCEVCQALCPHNRSTPEATHLQFQPVADPRDFSRARWLAMSEEEFIEIWGETPLTRAGLARLQAAVRTLE